MDWKLIHRFLSDQCTEAERRKVEQWLQDDPAHRVFMMSMQKIWEVEPRMEGRIDVKTAWEKFRNERMALPDINAPERAKRSRIKNYAPSGSGKGRKWYQRKTFYMAAAAVLLVAAMVGLFQYSFFTNEITYQEVLTEKGEKTSVKLSDGSLVMLNAESSIRIPSNYGSESRTLYLSGEGFFEVEHNAGKPFRVHSGDVLTEDLGTKFNIRAYADEADIEVVVAEGEVALSSSKSPRTDVVNLQANELGTASKTGAVDVKRISDLSSYIGWTQRRLVFDDTPFRQVITKLERWYGVKFIVTDPTLWDQQLTAEFEKQPLSNVLKLMTRTMNMEAEVKEDTVIFSQKD